MMNKTRLSNFELLRILSIFGVLYGHGVGMVNELPSGAIISEKPFSSFFYIFFSSIFMGGVNVFILISGWFGIRPSKKGILKYLFQVLFLLWGIYLICIASGLTDFNLSGIKICLGFTEGYWFIMAYLGLYLLAPILNVFIETVSKRQFQMVLCALFIFQCYYSWFSSYVNYFGGYSIVFFCILYLTGRFIKLYPVRLVYKHSLLLYGCLIVFIALVSIISLLLFGHALRFLRYDNPFLIMACVCLLVSFDKIKLQSKLINWIAGSCFAVYIIHFNPFVLKSFLFVARRLSNMYSGIPYSGAIVVFLVTVFLICTFLDQIRIIVWKRLAKIFSIS